MCSPHRLSPPAFHRGRTPFGVLFDKVYEENFGVADHKKSKKTTFLPLKIRGKKVMGWGVWGSSTEGNPRGAMRRWEHVSAASKACGVLSSC